MEDKLLNAITVDLIDKLNYLPVADSSEALAGSGKIRLFEKRDLSEYSIVELLDAGVLSRPGMEQHARDRLDWLSGYEIIDFTGKPSLLQIFFLEHSDPSKVALIKELQNDAIDKGRNTAFIIMDLENEDLILDWGLQDPSPEIENLLWHWFDGDLSQYDSLPDLEGLVNRHEPEPVLAEVSKNSPATYVLICLNVVIWLMGQLFYYRYHENYIETWGIKNNALILGGQYWRLFTAAFLHSDFMHLASNCFSLLIFGTTVERVFGTRRYLAIYLAAGLAGNFTSFVFSPYNSLGASGAIMGIGGALIHTWTRNRYFFSLRRKQYLTLVFLVFFNIFYGFLSPGIDNYAHVGGFACGFALASLLYPGKR